MKQEHPFDLIVDEGSKLLVLGSFPSLKSFEKNFYYAHPRNQFWPIMERLFDIILNDIEEKRAFLHAHHIALWDVYGSLTREQGNSSDTNLSELVPHDFVAFLKQYPKIETIFFTGKKAYDGFKKHFGDIGVETILLPSTSPAYAALSLEKKLEKYRIIKEKLENRD